MRSIAAALTVILLLATLFCVPAYGAVPWTDSAEPGEILFRQSFSDISDYAKCGWQTGTLTAEGASISVADGALAVKSLSGRAYVLMPETKRGNDATVEFTFRFTESGTENGSLSVLLTCRGEEPTNVTSVVIRANGTVDDFSDLDEAIVKAIRSGSKIKVEIPIEDGPAQDEAHVGGGLLYRRAGERAGHFPGPDGILRAEHRRGGHGRLARQRLRLRKETRRHRLLRDGRESRSEFPVGPRSRKGIRNGETGGIGERETQTGRTPGDLPEDGGSHPGKKPGLRNCRSDGRRGIRPDLRLFS